jgi:hypothetical protein
MMLLSNPIAFIIILLKTLGHVQESFSNGHGVPGTGRIILCFFGTSTQEV